MSLIYPVYAKTEQVQKQNYVGFYGMDPETLDYLYTYKVVDSQHFANFIDGLIEHDAYGNLVGAMATHWEGNEDSTIWRFDLQQGVYWYTDEGEEYDEVTAEDFVTGLQHAADFQSQTLYLLFYHTKSEYSTNIYQESPNLQTINRIHPSLHFAI